jgi:hypothetical protein
VYLLLCCNWLGSYTAATAFPKAEILATNAESLRFDA